MCDTFQYRINITDKFVCHTMRLKQMSSSYSLQVCSIVIQVILMDATVATGAAAMMAIRVLLDHDVPEENINLVSLLMAESGAATLK